jgi:hypothetical protein
MADTNLTGPRRAWVEALRSDKYKQGQGCLRLGDRFCCLGVACELAVEAGVIPPPTKRDDGAYQYGKAAGASTACLPDCVRDWLGVTSHHGSLRGVPGSLAGKNDQGLSFGEIADLIEQHASTLFETRAT